MINSTVSDARFRALSLIENHIDLNSYLCPTIFLNEFDDSELMRVANTIDDHCTRALLKKGLDACDDMLSIDLTDYKLAYYLDTGDIDPEDPHYNDAVCMRDYIDELDQRYKLEVGQLKKHLITSHDFPKFCFEPLLVEWLADKAA